MTPQPAPGRRGRRASGDEERRTRRRQAIAAAGLDLFARHGYGDTRLEDVARAAGIAKGTLYLYFPSKEALFEGIVTQSITPALNEAAELLPAFEGTTRALMMVIADLLVSRILESPARTVLQLMISEGPRFPAIAAFHHREVVQRGLALVRAVMARGQARGEITSDAAERFPQLVFAPALTALVWNSLFGAFDPLDARAFVHAHLELMLRGLEGGAP